MSDTAALTGNWISTKADIIEYTRLDNQWARLYEANQEKLEKQEGYETKWEDAYDSAINNTRELKFGGIVVGENNDDARLADAYAHAKVSRYDEELSLELAELDIEYETMKDMYDTLLESLRAQEQAEKQAVTTAAQDTGLIQG